MRAGDLLAQVKPSFGCEDTLDHVYIGQLPFLVLIDVDVREHAAIVIVIDDLQVIRSGNKIANCELPVLCDLLVLQFVLAPVL